MPAIEPERTPPAPLAQNLESLVAIQRQEELRRTAAQRRVEYISGVIGSARYLAGLCAFAALWVAYNLLAAKPFDPFPFPLLAGVLALAALVSATVILIAQNRQSFLEQQRSHLALQVGLLSEHKVTKLIHLIEELRQDLPMVQDRQDPHVEVLREAADAEEVLAAIEQVGLIDEQTALGQTSKSATSSTGESGQP
jgi:uncharacterized membrane protein